MSEKPKIYDKNGQLTEAGCDLEGVISKELERIIEKYADGYNRIEFEHLIGNSLHLQTALHFIKTHEWPQQKEE